MNKKGILFLLMSCVILMCSILVQKFLITADFRTEEFKIVGKMSKDEIITFEVDKDTEMYIRYSALCKENEIDFKIVSYDKDEVLLERRDNRINIVNETLKLNKGKYKIMVDTEKILIEHHLYVGFAGNLVSWVQNEQTYKVRR